MITARPREARVPCSGHETRARKELGVERRCRSAAMIMGSITRLSTGLGDLLQHEDIEAAVAVTSNPTTVARRRR
jgi:hypothetical protein